MELLNQPNQQQEQPETSELEVIKKIVEVAPTLGERYAASSKSAAKAVAALQQIKKVETDEELEAAQALLVKVRKTYEKILATRKGDTSLFDELKKKLMLPEAAIDPTKDNEYSRVKGYCDKFAQKKYEEAEAEKKRIERERKQAEGKIQIKVEVEKRKVHVLLKAKGDLENSIADYKKTFTLENFDEKVKRFNVRPTLKETVYNDIFNVPYDTTAFTAEEFAKFINEEIKTVYTYEKIQEAYVADGLPVINQAKETLPSLKEELQRIANAQNEEEKQRLEQERLEKENREKEERENLQQKQLQESQEKINDAGANMLLDATFEAQKQLQQVVDGKTKGSQVKYIPILTAPHSESVAVLAELLYKIYTNPEFEGHYKKDATGELKKDKDGNPVYIDFVADILKEYVDLYGNEPVNGVEFKPKVVTSARGKKD